MAQYLEAVYFQSIHVGHWQARLNDLREILSFRFSNKKQAQLGSSTIPIYLPALQLLALDRFYNIKHIETCHSK
jgi:hypothetical protein